MRVVCGHGFVIYWRGSCLSSPFIAQRDDRDVVVLLHAACLTTIALVLFLTSEQRAKTQRLSPFLNSRRWRQKFYRIRMGAILPSFRETVDGNGCYLAY